MEETAAVPPSATNADSLVPNLKKCGYAAAQIAAPFKFDRTDIDVVAFAGKPWDNWSACLAAVNLEGDSKASAAKAQHLGATSVFVCGRQRIDWWGLGPNGPTTSKPIEWVEVDGFFGERKAELAPRAIYDAKLRRPGSNPVQMTFFDVGLMPAVEKNRGETLLRLVRSEIDGFHDELGDRIRTEQDWEHVYRAVFWLLTAKVLNNKNVPNFINVDLLNIENVFRRIGKHHGVTESLPPFGVKGLRAMEQVAGRLSVCGSLADVSSESIAYLYEHALIDMAVNEGKTDPKAKPLSVRKRRGIHGTPSVLRDHMLSQLWPLIEDIKPSERNVLEPACGHAPFLTGIMRWLREWDAKGEAVTTHGFLRDRLRGLDDYAFARELAKLNLTIADAAHKNSWTIDKGDMFAPGVLRRHVANAHILLSNPPYESFAKVGAKRYLDTNEPVTAETQGVEMLKRTLPYLTAGSVFGVVMPVGVLHDKESKAVRKELLRDFDVSEISVFADNLFEHGDHEVAVLMGRKKKPRSSAVSLMYRRVREAGMEAFKERLAFSWEREVPQSRFTASDDADLRVPELDELWTYLAEGPTLGDYATVGQGMFHRGAASLNNAWTIHDPPRKGDTIGFSNVPNDLMIYSLPKAVGINMAAAVIDRTVAGEPTGKSQVLLNYHPVARKPWRLKAVLDHNGHAFMSSFSAIRPNANGPSTEYLWAVMNSPVANAFAYSHLAKRNILVGTMRTMPVPARSAAHEAAVEQTARNYRQLAARVVPASGTGDGLFSTDTQHTGSSPTSTQVRDALLAMDAAVLRAYGLPVQLERQLLDLFNGAERKGVGCTFGDYFPAGFKSLVPLHKFISSGYRGSTVDQVAARMKPSESSAGTAALRAAAEAFGGDDDKAARYARASALLNKWADEKGDFDARVEPVIDKAIKDSAPRHFTD